MSFFVWLVLTTSRKIYEKLKLHPYLSAWVQVLALTPYSSFLLMHTPRKGSKKLLRRETWIEFLASNLSPLPAVVGICRVNQ